MVMEQKELYRLLDLQPEMVKQLEEIGADLNLEPLAPYIKQLTKRETAAQAYNDLKAALQEDEGNMKMLYCQMQSMCLTFENYKEKNIPVEVFTDTMKCYTRFIRECQKKNGWMFFDRGWWTFHQISMEIFRIGALEYQFGEYEGKNVLYVHIPSDADITSASVDSSFEEAGKFFAAYYGDYAYDKYVCESWLLSPVLASILPETSHIKSFRNRFTIVKEEPEAKDFLEWLFQVPDTTMTDYASLSENTSLQRRAKELALAGTMIGVAWGVMDVPEYGR